MILKRALLYSKSFASSTISGLYMAFVKFLRGIFMIDKRDTLKLVDLKKSEVTYRFPKISSNKVTVADCSNAVDACPTGALTRSKKSIQLNLFDCVRCGECMNACDKGVIEMTYSELTSFTKREQGIIDFCS